MYDGDRGACVWGSGQCEWCPVGRRPQTGAKFLKSPTKNDLLCAAGHIRHSLAPAEEGCQCPIYGRGGTGFAVHCDAVKRRKRVTGWVGGVQTEILDANLHRIALVAAFEEQPSWVTNDAATHEILDDMREETGATVATKTLAVGGDDGMNRHGFESSLTDYT